MKRFFLKVLFKSGLSKYVNLTLLTRIQNTSFRVPLWNETGRDNLQISEFWMIDLFKRILSADKTYVDVGVNIGQTLLKLKAVVPQMPYIGFEPNPHCVNYVRGLVARNKFDNVTIFPVGISNETKLFELSFFSEDASDTAASIIDQFRDKSVRKEFIPCFKPTDIFQHFPVSPIGVLKIDVEGAEKEVIEGFREKILEDRPLIQLEILPVYHAGNVFRMKRQEELEDLLEKLDYTLFRIHKTDARIVRLERIEHIGIHDQLDWCEYLVLPNEKVEVVTERFGA